MSAIATAQAGNWSNPATWIGGVVPGNGDTVTLDHNVTVDVPTVVGSSPASGGTPAIAWDTANVVLSINASLTLRGDIIPKDDFTAHDLIVQAAGTTVSFDATQAADPSGTHYKCLLWNDAVGWRWKINGTSSQTCMVRSVAGAGAGFFDSNGHVGGPRINASYTHFLRIGDAANRAAFIYLGNGPAPEFVFDHCVFESCGEWLAHNGIASTVQAITHSVFKGGVAGVDATLGILESAATPGTIDDCYFSGDVEAAFGGMVLTGTVYAGRLLADSDTASTLCQLNLISVDAAITAPGSMDQCYVKDFNAAQANPQGLKLNGAFGHDITNSVIESSFPTQGAGDLILNGDGAAHTYNIRGNLLIPAANGSSPGKLVSLINAGSASRLAIDHNTAVSNWSTGTESGVAQYGENGGGAAGEIVSLKSNLAWAISAGNAAILSRLAGSLQDEVAAASADFNATWNGASDGTNPLGYVSASPGALFSSSGTAGVHDKAVSADPFVDKARNFSRWGASLGGAGTDADTLELMRKRLDWTDPDYAPGNGATVSALVAWVRGGFLVTDALLNNAGHDGTTIGAMGYLSPVVPSIREQILEAAIAKLNTGAPLGVPPATRARAQPYTPDELPAIDVRKVREEVEYEQEGKRSYFRRRTLTLRVSHALAGDAADVDEDPGIVWASQVLDGQWTKLLEDSIEALYEWEYADEDRPYLTVHQDFRIHYHTVVGDQTRAK